MVRFDYTCCTYVSYYISVQVAIKPNSFSKLDSYMFRTYMILCKCSLHLFICCWIENIVYQKKQLKDIKILLTL